MSAALHLAGPDDLDRLAQLVAAFHDEDGIVLADTARRASLKPLLNGSHHGAAYLIGPARAPIGYTVVTFTWSVELGGSDALVDKIYLRPPVRGRALPRKFSSIWAARSNPPMSMQSILRLIGTANRQNVPMPRPGSGPTIAAS